MHWSMVTPAAGAPAETLLVTVTLQTMSLPPPLATPLHWLTEVTSWLELLTTVVHPAGGSTPAAARHVVAVIVELVAPGVALVFTIAIVQETS
jgi:hypothetical protein